MIDTVYFTAFILIFIRLFAFIQVVPAFYPSGTPYLVKGTLPAIIAFIIMPGIDHSGVNLINNNFALLTAAIAEIGTGLTFGFIVNLCFNCVRYAGSLMDMQIGFAMISMFDPNSSSNTTLIERMLYWFSLIIFLTIDGHHMLIKQLIESFSVVHLGNFILSQKSAMIIVQVFIKYFELGLRIAIPIILIIILTDLTLALVAKTVPQLNVMILGLPIKILLGLSVISLSLPIFYKLISNGFGNIPSFIREIYKVVPLVIVFASGDSGDKTEDATPHKLSEAKKKGQVAKSKEVNSALTLLASTIIIITLGEYAIGSFKDNIVSFLGSHLNMNLDSSSLYGLLILVAIRIASVLLPIVVPMMIIGSAANIIQTGFIKSTDPIKPQLSKINPINGFKKMFSMRTVMELIKDIAVISVVGVVGFNFLKSNFDKILNMGNLKFSVIIETVLDLTKNIFFRITLVMVGIALIDFIYQKYQFKKDMRMSKQEIKEEYKQQEGDPQIKSKIRQKQREMAMGRMMQQVPDASVVITNPTHIAVALKYEEGKMGAPLLLAKGSDHIAIKIKEKAKENDIPIIENKPLARLIYSQVEINSEIPEEMYQAVAEILVLVYKIKKTK
ncbi:fused FliR family export protein/FlhB family type III secretion system protein [Clostridium sp. MB40-C1]|uniref:fused FliR family export protein/FlhB family type III secretion system protein n=1 Tax=Clostridium sp. MB40-C1 TaxID=3070996 RepID=UPI0027E1A3B8|nr:fused FliR family export protein/FlhB family type III secretion system protein [Clostridium sp. MB40-C1]WMJ81347.1 fused FliR family export protein/FlhB family type III secretion system protein [Clostridium sp. MB40-C1]